MALNKEEKLLEEYKNCTQVLMNENRISWTRFTVFLAVSSAIVTIWNYLAQPPYSYLSTIGLFAIALLGLIMAIAWFFVVTRGHGFNDFWIKRLQEIEKELKVLRTFDEEREKDFWKSRPPWQKVRLDYMRESVPLAFAFIWSFLLWLSYLNLMASL